MGRHWLAFTAIVGVLCAVLAPRIGAAEPAQLPLRARLEQYGKLQEQLLELFGQKQYGKAAAACRQQMELIPESSEPYYNLGCAMARLGQKDDALKQLERAVALGFNDAAHLREDEDLASLHGDPRFASLVKTARQKQLDAPHEDAIDLPDLKTVEGFPDGGLRYRLRISREASASHPARLIVWLHPSGDSMDEVVERMAPQFARQGFALLVFTQKNYGFWSDDDTKALLQKTLPDVAKINGVDAKKPILMGFSTGGQVALQMWEQNPAAYGGLILDAAYPIDADLYAKGKIAPMALPHKAGITSCPIFVLVGGSDGGSGLWFDVEKRWHHAHVPLTLHVISGKVHEWLFTAKQIGALNTWLKDVSAGVMPSEEAPHLGPQQHLPGDRGDDPVRTVAPGAAGSVPYHRL